MNGKGSRRRPTNTERFNAGYDRAFRSEDMNNPEMEPRKPRLTSRMVRADKTRCTEIFYLEDIQTYMTENGSEYAALPVRNPDSPKGAPHKWMPMVNGHLTGAKFLVERVALDVARELANTPVTN